MPIETTTPKGSRIATAFHEQASTSSPGSAVKPRLIPTQVHTRFILKPDRLCPQSQSFSRSYGSNLPTSLTYIILSTRGCEPWRPAADWVRSGRKITLPPLHFQGPSRVHRTPQEPWRFARTTSLSRGEPFPGSPPLK